MLWSLVRFEGVGVVVVTCYGKFCGGWRCMGHYRYLIGVRGVIVWLLVSSLGWG